MKFISVLLLLGGYILVYAAVAKGGRFAAEPWEGVFHDAYGDGGKTPKPQAPQTPPTPPPPPIRAGKYQRGVYVPPKKTR